MQHPPSSAPLGGSSQTKSLFAELARAKALVIQETPAQILKRVQDQVVAAFNTFDQIHLDQILTAEKAWLESAQQMQADYLADRASEYGALNDYADRPAAYSIRRSITRPSEEIESEPQAPPHTVAVSTSSPTPEDPSKSPRKPGPKRDWTAAASKPGLKGMAAAQQHMQTQKDIGNRPSASPRKVPFSTDISEWDKAHDPALDNEHTTRKKATERMNKAREAKLATRGKALTRNKTYANVPATALDHASPPPTRAPCRQLKLGNKGSGLMYCLPAHIFHEGQEIPGTLSTLQEFATAVGKGWLLNDGLLLKTGNKEFTTWDTWQAIRSKINAQLVHRHDESGRHLFEY